MDKQDFNLTFWATGLGVLSVGCPEVTPKEGDGVYYREERESHRSGNDVITE